MPRILQPFAFFVGHKRAVLPASGHICAFPWRIPCPPSGIFFELPTTDSSTASLCTASQAEPEAF